MTPTIPVTYKTPDGVDRPVRWSFGAQRRIVEQFKMPIHQVIEQYDKAAFADILYACMYDEHGNPPRELTLTEFREKADPDEAPEMYAAVLSAMSKGKVPKNELAALIRQGLEAEARKKIPGFTPGASPESNSESAPKSSGFVPSESSTPSSNAGESENESSPLNTSPAPLQK